MNTNSVFNLREMSPALLTRAASAAGESAERARKWHRWAKNSKTLQGRVPEVAEQGLKRVRQLKKFKQAAQSKLGGYQLPTQAMESQRSIAMFLRESTDRCFMRLVEREDPPELQRHSYMRGMRKGAATGSLIGSGIGGAAGLHGAHGFVKDAGPAFYPDSSLMYGVGLGIGTGMGSVAGVGLGAGVGAAKTYLHNRRRKQLLLQQGRGNEV